MYKFSLSCSGLSISLRNNFWKKVKWTCPPQSALCRRPWARVVRVAPVVSSVGATRLVTTFPYAKMHGLGSVSCRDVTWQSKWNFGFSGWVCTTFRCNWTVPYTGHRDGPPRSCAVVSPVPKWTFLMPSSYRYSLKPRRRHAIRFSEYESTTNLERRSLRHFLTTIDFRNSILL